MKRKPTPEDWEVVLSVHGMIKGQAERNYPFMATRPPRQVEEDLLISFEVGQMAAIHAAVAWDKSVRFSTWAYRPIVWRIRHYWQREQQRKRAIRVMPATGKRSDDFDEDAFVWNKRKNRRVSNLGCTLENVELAERLLCKLKPNQRRVVSLYFGLDGREMNMSEMSAVTKVSRERNRQVLEGSLVKLRIALMRMKLESWEVLG